MWGRPTPPPNLSSWLSGGVGAAPEEVKPAEVKLAAWVPPSSVALQVVNAA